MKVTLKIKRFNPEVDKKPHWGEYDVEVEPTDRVLDALNEVKWNEDGSLAYRRSCAHGVCGSDAMRINGRNMLACKILMQDITQDGGTVTVEPLLGLAVQKDLIVDMEPFFAHYREVMPYLVNNDPLPANGRERLQSQADRERYDDTT
jgi:succinate dehydrogenase / fumarate reductase iron-sulfur subunit